MQVRRTIRIEAAPYRERSNHAVRALHQQDWREFRRDFKGRQHYRTGSIAAGEQHRHAAAREFHGERFDSRPRTILLREQ
jgi:hypothetical protein